MLTSPAKKRCQYAEKTKRHLIISQISENATWITTNTHNERLPHFIENSTNSSNADALNKEHPIQARKQIQPRETENACREQEIAFDSLVLFTRTQRLDECTTGQESLKNLKSTRFAGQNDHFPHPTIYNEQAEQKLAKFPFIRKQTSDWIRNQIH